MNKKYKVVMMPGNDQVRAVEYSVGADGCIKNWELQILRADGFWNEVQIVATSYLGLLFSLTTEQLLGKGRPKAGIGMVAGGSVFTHAGRRVAVTGRCEKCNAKTNWLVDVGGRNAHWCGCGN